MSIDFAPDMPTNHTNDKASHVKYVCLIHFVATLIVSAASAADNVNTPKQGPRMIEISELSPDLNGNKTMDESPIAAELAWTFIRRLAARRNVRVLHSCQRITNKAHNIPTVLWSIRNARTN